MLTLKRFARTYSKKNLIFVVGVFAVIVMMSTIAASKPVTISPQISNTDVVIVEASSSNVINRVTSSKDFSIPLTIENRNTTENVVVTIGLGALTRDDGTSNLYPTISWNAENQERDTLLVPNGHRKVIIVSGDLPANGSYSTWLYLQYGDYSQKYEIRITRQPVQDIEILEAENGRITLDISGKDFTYLLTVIAPYDLPIIDDLQITLGPLGRSDGQPKGNAFLSCSVCNQGAITLQPNSPETITLDGYNFDLSTYRTSLVLSYHEKVQVYELVINRSDLKDNLDIVMQSNFVGTKALRLGWPILATDIYINISIHETIGQKAEVYYPRLSALNLLSDNGDVLSLSATNVILYQRMSDGALVEIRQSTVPTSTFSIPPYGSVDFSYKIGALDRAGVYQGEISVYGPNSAQSMVSVSARVKEPWYVAFILIVVGVALSTFMQFWIGEGRQRTIVDYRINQLRYQLRKVPDSETHSTFIELIDRTQEEMHLKIISPDEAVLYLKKIQVLHKDFLRLSFLYRQISQINTERKKAFPYTRSDAENKSDQIICDARNGLQILNNLPDDLTRFVNSLSELLEFEQNDFARDVADCLTKRLEQIQNTHTVDEELVQNLINKIKLLYSELNKIPFDEFLSHLEPLQRQTALIEINFLEAGCLNILQEADSFFANNQGLGEDTKDVLNRTLEDLKKLKQTYSLSPVDELNSTLLTAQKNFFEVSTRIFNSSLQSLEQMEQNYPELAQVLRPEIKRIKDNFSQATSLINGSHLLEGIDLFEKAKTDYTDKILIPLLRQKITAILEASKVIPLPADNKVWDALTSTIIVDSCEQLQQILDNLKDEHLQIDYYRARGNYIKSGLVLMSGLGLRLKEYQSQTHKRGEWWASRFLELVNNFVRESALPEKSKEDILVYGAEININHLYSSYIQILTEISNHPIGDVLKASPHKAVTDLFIHTPKTISGLLMQPQDYGLIPAIFLRKSEDRFTPSNLDLIKISETIRSIRTNDIIIAILVVLVASVSGLGTLWASKATFGNSFVDYLGLLLWGFGLHKGIVEIVGKYIGTTK